MMKIEKNNVPFLQFRKKILDISELEKKYDLLLPPIFKSFITVFEPCFYSLKAKLNSKNDLVPFTFDIYPEYKKSEYSIDDDIMGLSQFKEPIEIFTFPSNLERSHGDHIFISDHGEAGGFLLGIGHDNRDKIYYSNFTKPYIFYADNIYHLISNFEKIYFDYFNEIEDPNTLYKNWGEDFWRVREDPETT